MSLFDVPNEDVWGYLFTLQEFKEMVENGALIDYDGYGNPSNGTHHDWDIIIRPSELSEIPSDATHILWFNR